MDISWKVNTDLIELMLYFLNWSDGNQVCIFLRNMPALDVFAYKNKSLTHLCAGNNYLDLDP